MPPNVRARPISLDSGTPGPTALDRSWHGCGPRSLRHDARCPWPRHTCALERQSAIRQRPPSVAARRAVVVRRRVAAYGSAREQQRLGQYAMFRAVIPVGSARGDCMFVMADGLDLWGLISTPPQSQPGDRLTFAWPRDVELVLPGRGDGTIEQCLAGDCDWPGACAWRVREPPTLPSLTWPGDDDADGAAEGEGGGRWAGPDARAQCALEACDADSYDRGYGHGYHHGRGPDDDGRDWDDDGRYRDYEQGYEQGYGVSQQVGLHGAHDEDAAPAPDSPAHDPWYDDDEDGESHEDYDAWFESHYDQSEWGDSGA